MKHILTRVVAVCISGNVAMEPHKLPWSHINCYFNYHDCGNYTRHDFNATAFASQVITASFSFGFYFCVLLISGLGVCFKSARKVFSSHATIILFLIGAIMVSLNVFNTSDNKTIMLYHRIVSASSVGIVFFLLGAICFFQKPTGTETSTHRTLGEHEPSKGLLVIIITLPLTITELMFLSGAQASEKEMPSKQRKLWPLLVTYEAIFIVQKSIQAAVYISLRNLRIRETYRENAQFYFKILAFFNFVQWVDCLVNVESDLVLIRARITYGEWFVVLELMYKALTIDYRLLCSFIFLEHSMQIQNETGGAETASAGRENETAFRIYNMTYSDRQYRNLGYLLGFFCFLAPFSCAVYYVHNLELPVYIRVATNFLNALCIFVCGMILLLKNKLDFERKDKESMSVKIMACCLGSVGFASLMINAALAQFWASSQHYLRSYHWACAELSVRGLTATFLMVMFLHVNARALPLNNPDVKINHFLVPALMLGVMANCAACLVDQYFGPLDKRIRCEITGTSLRLLHDAGEPMYLGFLIHVFLHFLIMQTRMGRSKRSLPGNEDAPLLHPNGTDIDGS